MVQSRLLQRLLEDRAGEGGWGGGNVGVETRWLGNHNTTNVALITLLHQPVAESVSVRVVVTHMYNYIGTSSLAADYN